MMLAQLVFAGLVVVVVAVLIYVGAVTQDAGIPVIAGALGYVFGAGAQKVTGEAQRLENNR